MAMYKTAQFSPTMNEEFIVSLPVDVQSKPNDEVVFYPEEPTGSEVIEMHAPDKHITLTFDLPVLPGAEDDFEVELEEDQKLEENDKEEKSKDKSKADDNPKDLNWVKDFLNKIPRHRGENLGLERAKSYLGRGLNHLSKMVQEDHDGTIDISSAEDARVSIEQGIERLDKELQKRKKKASVNTDLTKEASIGVGGVIVTVPLIVSAIARVCINSTISGGKDIEDTFRRLAQKYKLTDREKVEVIQLLSDMNYPFRRDMGFMVDDDEKYQYSSEKNYNLVPNYQT